MFNNFLKDFTSLFFLNIGILTEKTTYFKNWHALINIIFYNVYVQGKWLDKKQQRESWALLEQIYAYFQA